jgi:hypothetical protein
MVDRGSLFIFFFSKCYLDVEIKESEIGLENTNVKRHLRDRSIVWRIKINIRAIICEMLIGLIWLVLGSSCVLRTRCNAFWIQQKGSKFVGQLRNCKLLKKNVGLEINFSWRGKFNTSWHTERNELNWIECHYDSYFLKMARKGWNM